MPNLCRLALPKRMLGRQRKIKQDFILNKPYHVQLRTGRDTINLPIILGKVIPLLLRHQLQTGRYPDLILHALQAALTTQLTTPAYGQHQHQAAISVHATTQGITYIPLRIGQHVLQSDQRRYRHVSFQLQAIAGKIRTVDELPSKHEARMIYISPTDVKENKG